MLACTPSGNRNSVENFREQESAARELYDKFILGYDIDSSISDYFTASYLQRLANANEYDENIDYAVWYLRTGNTDGDGESKVLKVTSVNDSTVNVEYLDMGSHGNTQLVFVKENDRWLVNEALNEMGEPVIP